MARMKFICDAERCIECNGCVTACKQEHDIPWGVNRRRVVTINDGVPGERSISVACMHCSDAPCMAVCPVDCFREGLAWLETPLQVDPIAPDAPTQDVLSLLELPGALGLQQLPEIRADGAYLYSPLWAEGGAGRPLQVGLVSAAGHPGVDPFCIREFQKRTLPMGILWRLVDALRQSGAQVYDLQFGADAFRHRALGLSPLPTGTGLTGFADTARAVAQLDLVISVDTAMAHLTGAMGRFAWVLLPWSADPRAIRNRRN